MKIGKKNILQVILIVFIKIGVIENIMGQKVNLSDNCKLIKVAFTKGLFEYRKISKKDTIYFESRIIGYDNCIEKYIEGVFLSELTYSEKDTILFSMPKMVISLSHFSTKNKFVRIGFHSVKYEGLKRWDVSVSGNIEIYFDKKYRSIRIRKIIQNF